MVDYPWYATAEGDQPLEQGHFVKDCPVVVPPKAEAGDEPLVEIKEYDVVVVSQSCDLRNEKIELVLVCSVWLLDEFNGCGGLFKGDEGRESLRRGNVHGYHLLNKCEIADFQTDFLVVDFRSVYGVDYGFLRDLCMKNGKRLSLLPPYREHLSQAFARFFMRVGLPADIPAFK